MQTIRTNIDTQWYT